MENVLKYTPLVGVFIGLLTIFVVIARFWSVPPRLEELERKVSVMEQSLSRIEGRMEGNVEILTLVALGRFPVHAPLDAPQVNPPESDE